MFYAVIDAASLCNPTILNDFHCERVTVNHESESTTSNYHFNFLLRIEDAQIEETITKIQKEMLLGWYAFFWNDSILHIVFNIKKFEIQLPDGWSSEICKVAQIFGKTQNIPEEYLDFKKFFLLHKNL